MRYTSRKMIDRSITGIGYASILLTAAFLLLLLIPILVRGSAAYVFRGTIEHRRVQLEVFNHGDQSEVDAELKKAHEARQQIYDLITDFENELQDADFSIRQKYMGPLAELKISIRELLGPFPGEPRPALMRDRYGQTRWDRVLVKQKQILFVEQYDYSDPTKMGQKVLVPRVNDFKGTLIEPIFSMVKNDLEEMLLPHWTFYWRFLTDGSHDAHFFGGIWKELLGTIYLTIGAILFATPMGVISAIYLIEYAKADSRLVRLIRTCICTLAGVPSIVFGLFGLAFFINTLHVSQSKSVLAGSLTLAVLILPLVIRSAEEAIRAVPRAYKEASLSLGASKWRTIVKVILPAALPGILTGIVISMGRAAGETAPIIFTAAVSVGPPLLFSEVFSNPTPALPWNIYNLCSEHEAVDEIRHVQYGMVCTLIVLVLLLNSVAIWMRARISKKLKG